MTKLEMIEQLHNGVCIITFTKKDGSERTLKGTLETSYISENNLTPKGDTPSNIDGVIMCVDTEINEWRSFSVDSVITFNGSI